MTPEDAPHETSTNAPGPTHVLGPTPAPAPTPSPVEATAVVGSGSGGVLETDVLGAGAEARFLEGVPELGPGSELGPYRIVSVLGRGGMGLVYRAVDPRLAREVALKTLPGTADRSQLERFLREARAAARLKHPGIVGVHEVNVYAGRRVIALELVEGESLAQRLAREGPLEPAAAAALVRGVALAVAAAHEAGVVHRDLKPSNVLLERDGRPRLADFGLARDDRATSLTTTGEILGTPAYMSPEQALGESLAIGPHTDVYGLGTILFETLAGRAPFAGRSAIEVIRKVAEQPPDSLAALRAARGLLPVPAALERLCLRALAKDPAARPASATELARELEAFTGAGAGPDEPLAPAPARAPVASSAPPVAGAGAPRESAASSPLESAATTPVVAGLGRRCLAFGVDWMLVAVSFDLVLAALGHRSWAAPRTGGQDACLGLLLLAYHTVLPATRRGATLGQRLVGIRLVRVDGGAPSLLATLARTLSSLLVVPTLGLGFIVAGQSGQALHDRIVKTRVVRRVRDDGQLSGPSTLVLGVVAWALVVVTFVGLIAFGLYEKGLSESGAPDEPDHVRHPAAKATPELGSDLADWEIRQPSAPREGETSAFTLSEGRLRIAHVASEPVFVGKRRDEWKDDSIRFRARVAPGTTASFLGRLRSAGPGAPATWDEIVLARPGLANALVPESGVWTEVELVVQGTTWEALSKGAFLEWLTPAWKGWNATGGFGFLVRDGALEVEDVRSKVATALDAPPRDVESERGALLAGKLKSLAARPGSWAVEVLDDKGERLRSVPVPLEKRSVAHDAGAARPCVVTLTLSPDVATQILPPATSAKRSGLRLVLGETAIPIQDYRLEPGGKALMTSIDALKVPDNDLRRLDAALAAPGK